MGVDSARFGVQLAQQGEVGERAGREDAPAKKFEWTEARLGAGRGGSSRVLGGWDLGCALAP
jgi:hypothetical protein